VTITNIHHSYSNTYSEEAVEYGELESFLRLKETWSESIEETRPILPTQPIGVPGASSPSQMAKPSHKVLFDASPASKTSSLREGGTSGPAAQKESLSKRNESEFDVGDELAGYGLQGVKVTDDDLISLVQELGLGGEDSDALVKGMSISTVRSKQPETEGNVNAEAEAVREGTKVGVGEQGDEKAENISEATA
jgi:hypothetical protein